MHSQIIFFFLHTSIFKKNNLKKKHEFINAFSHKKMHLDIHYICIPKNHAFINAFSQKELTQTYIIYAFPKIMHS